MALIICLITRLPLIMLLEPRLHSIWFVPFLARTFGEIGLDPWTSWLQSGGTPLAFPYSHSMLVAGFPTTFAAWLGVTWLSKILGGTFLAIDLIITYLLVTKVQSRRAGYFWATSPIAIFVTYVHGQTDVVIGVCLLVVVFSLTSQRWNWVGLLISIGVLAKFSVLLAIPNLLFFAISNPGYRAKVKNALQVIILCLAPVILYLVFSEGYRTMALGSKESVTLLQTSISLSSGVALLLIPLVYCTTLVYQLRVGRTTPFGLSALITLSTAAVVITSPSSVGWYLWFLPSLLVLFPASGHKLIPIGLYVFQLSAVATEFFTQPQATIARSSRLVGGWATLSDEVLQVFQTLTFVVGLSVVITVCYRAIVDSDPLGLGRAPVVIGLAGDSGVGKSTLSEAFLGYFPKESAQIVSGDDYHLFERGSPQWKTLTHLNPVANDLDRLQADIKRLKNRQEIVSRAYDHRDGRFYLLGRINPLDVVIVDGLHALRLPSTSRTYDLRVFISMGDDLRMFLKNKRDATLRGVSLASIDDQFRRRNDYELYVGPQEALADISIRVRSTGTQDNLDKNLICDVRCRGFSFPTSLVRNTLNFTSTSVIKLYDEAPEEVRLEVHADGITSDELESLRSIYIPTRHQQGLVLRNIQGGTIGYLSLLLFIAMYERRSQES